MSYVSVVMAVYNGERFLRQQVGSVLSELLPGDELIIIDDASTDASLALLKSISSPALQIYSNPSNLGVVGSFGHGLQIAAREVIFLCDQDDVWLSGKRAAFVAAFEQDPTVSVVISDAQVIDAQGQLSAHSFMATRGGFNGSVLATVWRNRYLGCAMALRRVLLESALPVPRQAPMHDMWFGVMGRLTGKVVYLPTPLLQYRRHTGNVSPSHRQSLPRMLRWRAALLFALVVRITSIKFVSHRTYMDGAKPSNGNEATK
jgi:cellulose synthase/poly-beta-1,6-N-acetylglucosamine synthase-like glycosyltransferase